MVTTVLPTLHIDIDVLVVVVRDRVFEDGGIAEAQFVVFVYQRLLGLVIALIGELLRLEDVGELACFMDLSEGTLADE